MRRLLSLQMQRQPLQAAAGQLRGMLALVRRRQTNSSKAATDAPQVTQQRTDSSVRSATASEMWCRVPHFVLESTAASLHVSDVARDPGYSAIAVSGFVGEGSAQSSSTGGEDKGSKPLSRKAKREAAATSAAVSDAALGRCELPSICSDPTGEPDTGSHPVGANTSHISQSRRPAGL